MATGKIIRARVFKNKCSDMAGGHGFVVNVFKGKFGNRTIKTLSRLSGFFRHNAVKLRWKLILPYFFLTFVLAILGIFLVSALVGKSMEERFYGQLLSSAETAGEVFKYREADQLSTLRSMMYTKGVGQAVVDSDEQSLYQILLPLKMNSNVYAVEVLDSKGKEVLGITGKKSKARSGAASFSDVFEVGQVTQGIVDNGKDKKVFIHQNADGERVFYTIGPIKHEGSVVGAIMVGTNLSSLLSSLKSQSLANVTFYDHKGEVLGTTIPNPETSENFRKILDKDDTFVKKVLRNTNNTIRETKRINEKQYDLVYVPLIAGGEAIGLYSVAVRDKYFMVAKANTRRSMVIFFMIGMLLVCVLGYALAKYISSPIIQLVKIAKKIAEGDLSHQTQVGGKDEIGLLAKTINTMSANIKDRENQLKDKIQELTLLYQTSRALKDSLDLKSIYRSVAQIFSESFKVSNLLLLETTESRDSLTVTIALNADTEKIPELLGQKVKRTSEFQVQETLNFPAGQDLLLENVKGGEDPVLVRSPLLIPLRTKRKSIGFILLGDTKKEMASWVNKPLLSAIGSEVAGAIENAHLYEDVSKRLSQLSSLQEAGEAMTSTLRLNDVIQTIGSHIKKAVTAANVSLILVEPKTGKLEIKFAQGPNVDEISAKEVAKRESIARWVLRSGQPILISPDSENSVPASLGRTYSRSVKDMLAIPLMVEDKPIGVFCASNKIGPRNFTHQDKHLLSTLASGAALSIKNAYLYRDVKTLFLGAVRSLVTAIEQKDPYTHGHSARVAAYALMIAKELGLDDKERESLEISALLHDVGKIGIAEDILLKPGTLTEAEFKIIREHPVKGVRIMEPIMEMKEVIPGMLYHHERYDGKGYPEGLKGLDIPLPGRIIAIADSFDALNSNRPYRTKMSGSQAALNISDSSGTQLDPLIVQAFLKALEKRTSKNVVHNRQVAASLHSPDQS